MALNPWDEPPREPLQLRHPRDIWAAAKQIDGLDGEWSYQIFITRASNFHMIRFPPHWAEPLSSFDALWQEVWFKSLAMSAGVPRMEIGSVTATFSVFRSVFSAPSNQWPIPEPDEPTIGQHTVSVIGIEDEDTLLFRHGWSEWPENYGVGRLTREYVDRYAVELWANRLAGLGPRQSSVESLAKAAGEPQFASLWRQSGRRGTQDTNIPNVQLRWWESYSLEENSPGEVLTLTLSKRIRAAVAIVVYGPAEATIIDLFVWPGYRRRGYASLLESIVAGRAKSRGANHLEAIVLDADVIRGSTRPSQFLRSRGYELTDHPDSQVRVVGRRTLNTKIPQTILSTDDPFEVAQFQDDQ
jgi:GNAT superfamily N-acetyltransferase